jgi:transcriptional regulator with XRE-family HTH domain
MSTAPPTSRLRAHRELIGKSLRQVARDTGISASALSRIEAGDNVPRRELARTLWRYYGGEVPLGDIYDPLFTYSEELKACPANACA